MSWSGSSGTAGFIIRVAVAGQPASGELCLLIHAILSYQRNEFRDDATIMVLERRPSRSTGLAGRRWCSGATGVPPVTGGSPSRAVQRTVLRGARRVWHDLQFKDLYRDCKEFELMQRALGFAALATLTVIPLLILVAAANPAPHSGLAGWVIYGMGLTGSSADAVTRLFSAPARVLGTTSVFSAVVLPVAGISFASSVQAGFERIWGLPAGPWHKIWRQAVWLVGLVAYIYAAATVGTVTNNGLAETAGRLAVAVVLGLAFFWWGLRFLVGGRVSYLAAMPGAAATLVGLGGLRVFSGLVFEPLIVRNAVSYGALGTVLIVQSWLIGVGFVLYGGQLFGRWFHDAWLQPWAHSRWGHGKEGEQDPESQNTPPG
jgi:membrane protein